MFSLATVFITVSFLHI